LLVRHLDTTMKEMKALPLPFLAWIVVIGPIGCHQGRTERDLHILDEPFATEGEIFIGKIRFGADTVLGSGQATWVHRAQQDREALDEVRTDLASRETLARVRRGIREQILASGFTIPRRAEDGPLLLETMVVDLEVLTEKSPRTGQSGSRTAMLEIRFDLRASSDRALLVRETRNEWVLFTGHDVVVEEGRPRFRGNDPDPIVVAVRFALREFLRTVAVKVRDS
jgi:hypothetical protein